MSSVNTAAMSAISGLALEVSAMTSKQARQELDYQAALSIARAMLENALITQEEYCRIESIFRAEYLPVFGPLYA
jgi:hypothetical protein